MTWVPWSSHGMTKRIKYNLGPAGFTHKNVLTFLQGPNKPRDDKREKIAIQ